LFGSAKPTKTPPVAMGLRKLTLHKAGPLSDILPGVRNRGVMTLHGAREKKQDWRPHVRTCLSEANELY